jgi:hypothetical protein
MKPYATSIAAVLALAVGGGALAQEGSLAKAFTANNAENCTQIVWSQETLERFPRIAVACREVVTKDGRTFVKFEGDVTRVGRRGEELDVRFQRGTDPVRLNPPAGMEIEVDGRKTPVARLRPGDKLTFYIPEDRLAANFYTEDTPTATPVAVAVIVPVTSAPTEQVAQTSDDYSDLPRTAGTLPLLGLLGSILIALGAGLTARRWMRSM